MNPQADPRHFLRALVDRVFDTNLRGPWVLSCEMARRLIEEKTPGRQVNISSIAATNYDGNGAALYSVTKSAIARMSEVLAVEWAPYTFFAYVTPIVSFAIAAALSKKHRVPDDQDIDQIYGPTPTPTGPNRTA